jgi:diguanylate cyclase (GGDEF)-like protein
VLAAAGSATAQERITLQLNWKHQFQFAGYYAAVEKGYYREAGFEVRLVEAAEGVDPIDQVLAGHAQYGVGASELALRRAQGQPVVVLAVVLQHSPLVLLARNDRAQSVHELAGKRIMLMPHETELYAYLAREGLPRSLIIEVPHSFDPGDLIKGKVDAVSGYSTDEPFLLRQAGLSYSAFSPRASGIDFYGDSLFTTEAQVRKSRARADAFRRASLRGWRYAMDNTGEIADLIRSRHSTRHSREHLLFEAEELRRLMQPELVEIGHSNPGRWRHIADVYAEVGMLPPGHERAFDGMIFEPNPQTDLTWLYRGLAAAVLAFLGIVALAWYQRRQLAQIRVLQGLLEEQAIRDPLTGLYNRRYLDDALERELVRAQREGYPVSVVMLDLDRFKALNDTHGHPAGDAVLVALAKSLREHVRAGDLACRWGGEEFLLVLPNMPLAAAAARADALRARFAAVQTEAGANRISATLSAGVAACPEHGTSPAELIAAADTALYRAKGDGRDRVCAAPEESRVAAAAA